MKERLEVVTKYLTNHSALSTVAALAGCAVLGRGLESLQAGQYLVASGEFALSTPTIALGVVGAFGFMSSNNKARQQG